VRRRTRAFGASGSPARSRTSTGLGLLVVWMVGLLSGPAAAEPASEGGMPQAQEASPPRADLAFEGVTVVDAVSGRRPDQRVVVSGDRLVFVGPMDADAPEAARTIDGRGRFLMPGLWDAHVHFVYEPELTEAMPELFLRYGVTSVRDTGGDLDQLVALRTRWAATGRATPRFFLSGPLLDGRLVVYDGATPAQPRLGTSVPDADRARAVVAELARRGADFIKIYELVSPEVFDALVSAARARRLPIAAHVPLSLTADVAGPRVDSMEHLRNVELACASDWADLLATRRERLRAFSLGRGYALRRGLHEAQRLPAIAAYDAARCAEVLASLQTTMQVPTLRLNAFNRSRPDREPVWQEATAGLPAPVRARWAGAAAELGAAEGELDPRFADWSLRLVGLMRRAGVPLAAGTDTPIKLAIPGESLHRELELLVASGLSEREALAAATLAPARFFGLEAEMGAVAVGQRADLVLLTADPLEEIRHTRAIEGVVSKGRWRPRDTP